MIREIIVGTVGPESGGKKKGKAAEKKKQEHGALFHGGEGEQTLVFTGALGPERDQSRHYGVTGRGGTGTSMGSSPGRVGRAKKIFRDSRHQKKNKEGKKRVMGSTSPLYTTRKENQKGRRGQRTACGHGERRKREAATDKERLLVQAQGLLKPSKSCLERKKFLLSKLKRREKCGRKRGGGLPRVGTGPKLCVRKNHGAPCNWMKVPGRLEGGVGGGGGGEGR